MEAIHTSEESATSFPLVLYNGTQESRSQIGPKDRSIIERARRDLDNGYAGIMSGRVGKGMNSQNYPHSLHWKFLQAKGFPTAPGLRYATVAIHNTNPKGTDAGKRRIIFIFQGDQEAGVLVGMVFTPNHYGESSSREVNDFYEVAGWV